tara:strand:- start:7275 stop:7613 length:339 start_codon:yes stop_codon:yes gene_type:complete
MKKDNKFINMMCEALTNEGGEMSDEPSAEASKAHMTLNHLMEVRDQMTMLLNQAHESILSVMPSEGQSKVRAHWFEQIEQALGNSSFNGISLQDTIESLEDSGLADFDGQDF